MKEELQSKLVEILSSIQSAAGKASDFALNQMPDIAQSYVVYGRVYYSGAMLFSIAILLIGCLACCWIHKRVQNHKFDEGAYVIAAVFGIFCLFGSLAITCENFQSAILVWFAPKVWLLKELASMIK